MVDAGANEIMDSRKRILFFLVLSALLNFLLPQVMDLILPIDVLPSWASYILIKNLVFALLVALLAFIFLKKCSVVQGVGVICLAVIFIPFALSAAILYVFTDALAALTVITALRMFAELLICGAVSIGCWFALKVCHARFFKKVFSAD